MLIKTFLTLLALGFAVEGAVLTLTRQTKIIGGNVAVISQYPSTVALLYTNDGITYHQACVGTILTAKSIVTAAHCLQGDAVSKWRARAGSSWANTGGVVHVLNATLIHPNFNVRTMDSDIAIIRPTASFTFSKVVQPGSIAGSNYILPDNQVVWAVGFGATAAGNSEQLRHIQIWSINQSVCAARYRILGASVTSNMACAGLLNTTSGAQCLGDSGGPLFHNGVVVGVYSWGFSCASAVYPGINTRISRFTTWLQNNANSL